MNCIFLIATQKFLKIVLKLPQFFFHLQNEFCAEAIILFYSVLKQNKQFFCEPNVILDTLK